MKFPKGKGRTGFTKKIYWAPVLGNPDPEWVFTGPSRGAQRGGDRGFDAAGPPKKSASGAHPFLAPSGYLEMDPAPGKDESASKPYGCSKKGKTCTEPTGKRMTVDTVVKRGQPTLTSCLPGEGRGAVPGFFGKKNQPSGP